jgi:hypothetical protein
MDSTKSGQTIRCASCGQVTPSYEIVNYGSMEHGYKEICLQCLNKEMAEAMGLEGFEHAKFEPVGLADCTGEVHEFHFRTNLFGTGVALDAFELRDGDPTFSEIFTAHLLTRNIRFEEDLVDQLFNSSEKRLARILLLLAHFGKEGKLEPVIPKISQETLSGMIGTTRSRVSYFLNNFRKLGFIDYDGYNGGMLVHSSLLNVILHD